MIVPNENSKGVLFDFYITPVLKIWSVLFAEMKNVGTTNINIFRKVLEYKWWTWPVFIVLGLLLSPIVMMYMVFAVTAMVVIPFIVMVVVTFSILYFATVIAIKDKWPDVPLKIENIKQKVKQYAKR